jgi:hypothetical protein
MPSRMNWTFRPFFDVEIDESIIIWVRLAQKWDGIAVFNVVR